MIYFEKGVTSVEDGVESKSYDKCDEKDAEYVHICGHDKNPPTSCVRRKL
jgi:hypothetical protein